MKTRIASLTIFVVGAQALIGCGGSNASSNPVSPSPPPPAMTTPSPPPPSLAVDLTGNYALTFEVGDACEQVPKEFRTRTYETRVRYYRSFESTDSFLADLSGAKFQHDQQPVWVDERL